MKYLFVVLALYACAPRIIYEPVPYEVEKLVYCAEYVDEVKYETVNMRKTDSPSLKVKLLLIERQQRIEVESDLRAELSGCQTPLDVKE